MYTTPLLLLAPADVPRMSTAVVPPSFDLAILSHRDAQRLDGWRTSFRVDLESEPGDAGTAIVYDCASLDAVNRTVWLVPGQRVKDVMIVERTFRLLWRPRSFGFAGYWEFRIERAVRRSR